MVPTKVPPRVLRPTPRPVKISPEAFVSLGRGAFVPARFFGGRSQDGIGARVIEMGQAELDGVRADGGGDFVHEGLDRKAGLRTFGIAEMRGAQRRARIVEAWDHVRQGM